MIKFNVTVHYKGTNDVPEKKEFYIIDNPYNWSAVCDQLRGILENTMHAITAIAIKPGESVL